MGYQHDPQRQIAVTVIDMQEGMWDDLKGPNPDADRQIRMQRLEELMRKELAPALGFFVQEMRARGAKIIFVRTDHPLYGDLLVRPQEGDKVLTKSFGETSGYAENAPFFTKLRLQTKQQGRDLQIMTSGVYAMRCVADTTLDLYYNDYDVRVIGDLVLNHYRPGQRERDALDSMVQHMNRDYGRIVWKDDVLRAMNAAPSAPVPGGP